MRVERNGAHHLQPAAHAAAAVGDDDARAARSLRAPLALLTPPLRSRQLPLACCCWLLLFSALASGSSERPAPRGGSQLDLEQPPQPAARVSIAQEPREPESLHRSGRAQISGSAHCGRKKATWLDDGNFAEI